MKKKTLNLNELKVKSFVTDLNDARANTAKGGGDDCGNDNTTVNSIIVCLTELCPVIIIK